MSLGIDQQIEEIEKEISKTKHNKATEHHIGLLRAKIASLKELKEKNMSKKASAGGFAVKKSGDATVIMVGFPSVGKSTLLTKLTNAESRIAEWEFTTVTVIPGMINYKGVQIQLLDVPGILEDAAIGKGRGREVLSVARAADLILILIDATKPEQAKILVNELQRVGLKNPNLLIVANKVDTCKKEELNKLQKDWVKISADRKIGLEKLLQEIYPRLGLMRVFTKPRYKEIDWTRPMVMKKNATIEDACKLLGKEWFDNFKYALVTGKSAKFEEQRVGFEHKLEDEDIITIVTEIKGLD